MRFKEKWNMLFHKKQMIKSYIVDDANKVHVRYVRLNDKNSFTLYEDKKFDINNTSVVYENGLPTFFYNINNPEPVDPHNEGWQPREITTELYFNAINNEIVKDIIKYSRGKKEDTNGTLMILLIILLVGMIGGFYYIYTLIEEMMLFNEEYKSVFDAIRESLLGGDLIE